MYYLICFKNCCHYVYNLSSLQNPYSPKAEILNFGIVDISEDRGIHTGSCFFRSIFDTFYMKVYDLFEYECLHCRCLSAQDH